MKMVRIISFIVVVFVAASCNNHSNTKKNDAVNGLRIVSLSPSVTKELITLNMAENIVGATSWCSIAKSRKELVVGNAMEVNIEKILLLKPDIVFASGLTKESTVNALRQNGIKVHKTIKIHSFKEICGQFLKLGELVGKKDLANAIVNDAVNKVDSMRNSVAANEDKSRVFIQIGAQPIFTVIPNTFMDDYITFSGCENLAFNLKGGSISRETVLHRNPDVIFIVTMGIVGEEEKNTWEGYSDLNAVKNNKIFILDSDVACTPTVLSFTETLEQVINCIY